MMKVFFVASEAVPFVKTGGLADVIGSLPGALRNLGIDARVILPRYGDIPLEKKRKMKIKKRITVSLGLRFHYCGIWEMEYSGIPFYFIENEYYFERPGLYGFGDDAERFAFFSRAVLESLSHLGFVPQILHCHDWHASLVSVFLKTQSGSNSIFKDIRTVFTVHNLCYQGIFPREVLEELLELGPEYFTMEGLEFYGKGSYLKGGLVFSDFLTTVSETYAWEIQTPVFGEKMDGLLRKRSANLRGIRNGLDYQLYDPLRDPEIFVHYRSSLVKKRQNKVKVQEILGLPRQEGIPLIAFINRLVEQKGLDLIVHALDEILVLDLQLVFLGTGEKRYEEILLEKSRAYPEKLAVRLSFDDSLARKIYAGADMFLMPSRFEPCGTGQLIAMRYGTIPIVRETGGLIDTVQPFNEHTGEGEGFTFTDFNAHDMLGAIKRALYFYQQSPLWSRLVKNAVKKNLSWDKPALEYCRLYNSLVEA